jgi:RNA polymerase sigma-70 factor (ECF subfamily)
VRFRSLDGADPPGGDGSALTPSARPDSGPEQMAVAAETHRRVLAALEELDDEFRVVVVLRDIEQMNYVEIADVLGIPAGTVKSRLHRAREQLKEKLADLVS